jgi:hypothetical protein
MLIKLKYARSNYQDAEWVIKVIRDKKKSLMEKGLLHEPDTRSSHQEYCWILRQRAMNEKTVWKEKSDEKLRMAKTVYEEIWNQQSQPKKEKGSADFDEWWLQNGYRRALILGDLSRGPEAEFAYQRVLTFRKDILGPTHDDMVESALQYVSTLEKQNKDTEKVEKTVREIWEARETSKPNSTLVLNCGHELGMRLYNREDYLSAEEILKEVW